MMKDYSMVEKMAEVMDCKLVDLWDMQKVE